MKAFYLTLALCLSIGAQASQCGDSSGYGIDLLFGNMITTPNLIAQSSCPSLGIKKGEFLQVFPQSEFFLIQSMERNSSPVSIVIPAEGDYEFTGLCPNRIANTIESKKKNIKVSMNPDTAAITITKAGSNPESCTLARCAAYGPCEAN
jgi:hypothetical protein